MEMLRRKSRSNPLQNLDAIADGVCNVKRTEDNMSRKRRGRGEGSISQRTDGLWEAKVSLGYDGEGKRRRKTIYGKTKGEVQEKLRKIQTDAQLGLMSDPTNLTIAKYLNSWLENTAKVKTSPTTYQRYEQLVRLHINPHIGGLRLEKVAPIHVNNLMGDLDRGGESLWTRKMAGALLHNALRQAVRLKLILHNPCSDVPRAKPLERELQILNEEQIKVFLNGAREKRLYSLFVLAIGSGMRQGEILGLEWSDIDFERGTVTVRRSLAQVKGKFILKEPKSKRSRRVIKLPAFVLDALHQHRQKMLIEENISKPVFCTKTGQYLGKSNLIRQVFKPIIKNANEKALGEAKKTQSSPTLLPDIRFHDLRHTHASILLAHGESIKAVSQRLGHSTVELTLRVYYHLLPGADDALADRLQKLLA
jgi:integrase